MYLSPHDGGEGGMGGDGGGGLAGAQVSMTLFQHHIFNIPSLFT
jgi:hypothetical protein